MVFVVPGVTVLCVRRLIYVPLPLFSRRSRFVVPSNTLETRLYSAGALDGIDHWDSLTSVAAEGTGDGGEGPRTEMLYNWDAYLMSSRDILWVLSCCCRVICYGLVLGSCFFSLEFVVWFGSFWVVLAAFFSIFLFCVVLCCVGFVSFSSILTFLFFFFCSVFAVS